MLEIISNNQLASSIISAGIIAIIVSVYSWINNRRDSKKIYNFLLGSKTSTNFTFRSTKAISSQTKISPERVAALCIKHPKIKSNEKEEESWMLIE